MSSLESKLAAASLGTAAAEGQPAAEPPKKSLFAKKKKKKKFGSKLTQERPKEKEAKPRAAAAPTTFKAADYASSARRGADVSAQNNCSLEALSVALYAARAFREGFARSPGSSPVADALREVLAGVASNDVPSAANEALRQALATRGGAIGAAFAYADAAEVLELLLDALEQDAPHAAATCTSVGYRLVRKPCLLCGDVSAAGPVAEQRDVRTFSVNAALVLNLLATAHSPTFADLFREARADAPVSCRACGERPCAVSGAMEAVAPVLVVNLTWVSTPAPAAVAQLVRGALLPFDAGVAFDGGAAATYLCVAIVCFKGDHYTAYARPPPSAVDLRYPPRWTLRDRFVDRGSGDLEWLLGELSGAKPKLPSLMVYVRV